MKNLHYAICMYTYLTRIKDKHRGVTNEFQVNPKNHMLHKACKTPLGMFMIVLQAPQLTNKRLKILMVKFVLYRTKVLLPYIYNLYAIF
jgi:hypothetical protein